jgi:hypothetical protein
MSSELARVVEGDLEGFGYGRVEYYEEHGDSSRLEITFRDNSNDPMQTMRIVGSIEIEEFFKLIDRVRAVEGETTPH